MNDYGRCCTVITVRTQAAIQIADVHFPWAYAVDVESEDGWIDSMIVQTAEHVRDLIDTLAPSRIDVLVGPGESAQDLSDIFTGVTCLH